MDTSNSLTTSPAPTLNPALRPFWTAPTDEQGIPARYRVLYGGRDSTKSWDAAGFAIFLAQHCKLKFMCCRQFQNRIEESVYSLLKIQIERFGLQDEFVILNNKIRHRFTGTEFIFYGLWRNFSEIKSTEGIDILWVEEAQFLTAEQWRDLEPTIRKEGSQIWMVFNPGLVTDFVWRRFVVNPPAGAILRKINYDENPFLTETSKRTIAAMYASDPDEAQHVYGGEPRTDDESAIIKRSWIMAALDAHDKLGIRPSGNLRVGYDPADDGDTNATVTAYGFLTTNVQEWKGKPDQLMKSCKRVYTQARSLKADIYYDDIGVGAFAGSKFAELNEANRTKIRYMGFGAGNKVMRPDAEYQAGVTNRDFFANLKAQAWWLVADRLRNTYNAIHNGEKFSEDELISINSNCDHLEKLIDELSTPQKDYDANGKVKVEGKKDLARRGVSSPNIAEAFICAYSPIVGAIINYKDLL